MTHTLESLAEELPTLQLDRFDYEIAWKLGCLMQAEAAAHALPVGISVAHGPDLVFSLLMPGATPDNFDWMARKRAVATRFHRSSWRSGSRPRSRAMTSTRATGCRQPATWPAAEPSRSCCVAAR